MSELAWLDEELFRECNTENELKKIFLSHYQFEVYLDDYLTVEKEQATWRPTFYLHLLNTRAQRFLVEHSIHIANRKSIEDDYYIALTITHKDLQHIDMPEVRVTSVNHYHTNVVLVGFLEEKTL